MPRPVNLFETDKDPLTRYGNVVPELSQFTQNAPDLPPHLRDIILNKVNACWVLLFMYIRDVGHYPCRHVDTHDFAGG